MELPQLHLKLCMISTKDAVLSTIAYADIFDYPLTLSEISRWLIKKKSSETELKQILNVSRYLNSSQHYYFLKAREKVVKIRLRRKRDSFDKWKIANRAAAYLKIIPTLKLVGVTGSLALNNTDITDDIDLFLITQKGAMWISRFLAIILIELVGLRRRPGDTSFQNKICLNMFMDESKMKLPQSEQDLFAAHEVLQMKPLWSRNYAYESFLKANDWTRRILPNAYPETVKKLPITKLKQNRVSGLERIAKFIQISYMSRHRTTEVIRGNMLRFHPVDVRGRVRVELASKLERLRLPFDIFFRSGL